MARHVLKLPPLGYYSRHPCAWTSATLSCMEISSFIQAICRTDQGSSILHCASKNVPVMVFPSLTHPAIAVPLITHSSGVWWCILKALEAESSIFVCAPPVLSGSRFWREAVKKLWSFIVLIDWFWYWQNLFSSSS